MVASPLGAILVSMLLGFGSCTSVPPNEVVVYVAVDRAQAEPLLAEFESRTGIRVRAVYDSESAKVTGLVQRLLSESNHPRCDVFWNNEVIQTMMLAERGLLEEYESPSARDIGESWRDPHHRWTGQALRARVLVYNPRWVPRDQAPRGLRDLLDTRWKGRVAMANPQFGSTRTHVAALFALWGPDVCEKFLLDLLANGVRIVDGNATVKHLVAQASAESSIVIGLTDSDDVANGRLAGESVDSIHPDQAAEGTLVFPTTVSLVLHAPHLENAKQLIDYLLDVRTVEKFARRDSGYTPTPRSHPLPTPEVHAYQLSYEEIHRQLIPSSQWTADHVLH